MYPQRNMKYPNRESGSRIQEPGVWVKVLLSFQHEKSCERVINY